MTVDEAIVVLNSKFEGYPKEAIQALLDSPEEAAGKIFKEMETVLEKARQDVYPKDLGADYVGFLLLGVLKQPGTFQRLGEYLKEAKGAAETLYDELLTMELDRIFYTLYEKEGDADLLESWILDPDIDEWARSSMLAALVSLVHDGRYPKDRFIAFCNEIAKEAAQGKEFGYVPSEMVDIMASTGWKEMAEPMRKLEEEEVIMDFSIGYGPMIEMIEHPNKYFKKYGKINTGSRYHNTPYTLDDFKNHRIFWTKEKLEKADKAANDQFMKSFEKQIKEQAMQMIEQDRKLQQQLSSSQTKPTPSSPATHAHSSNKSKSDKKKQQKKAAKKARKKNKK